MDSLVAMLTEDVLVSMPPLPLEFAGLNLVARFLAMVPFRPGHPKRVTAARANGQPALVVYGEEAGVWRSLGILVFTLSGDKISAITHFDRIVLPSFGAPDELAAPLRPAGGGTGQLTARWSRNKLLDGDTDGFVCRGGSLVQAEQRGLMLGGGESDQGVVCGSAGDLPGGNGGEKFLVANLG